MTDNSKVKQHYRTLKDGTRVHVDQHDRKRRHAKGIPDRDFVADIPERTGNWGYTVHDHHAKRAGRHYDLRLDDGRHAHSWAMRKWPEPGQLTLAIQQPTHKRSYMDFEGNIGQGYGAGVVKMHDRGWVEVVETSKDKVIFNRFKGKIAHEYVLFRTKAKHWLLLNRTTTEGKYKYPREKEKMKTIEYKDGLAFKRGSMQPKVDGAHGLVVLEPGKRPRVFSYRTSKKGDVLEWTHKFEGLFLNKVPKDMKRTVLRAEIYLADRSGKPMDSEKTAGILNSGIEKARKDQKGTGGLKIMPFNIVDDEGSYYGRMKQVKELAKRLPFLEVPETVDSPRGKMEMIRKIRNKRHPMTSEGVILRSGANSYKAKVIDDADVYLHSIFEGTGKYKGKAAGGFSYSRKPGGPPVGKVGTGLSDKQRKELWENRGKLKGKVARIAFAREMPSGAFFQPRFRSWHVEKNL